MIINHDQIRMRGDTFGLMSVLPDYCPVVVREEKLQGLGQEIVREKKRKNHQNFCVKWRTHEIL